MVGDGSGVTSIAGSTFELNAASANGGAVYVGERSGPTTIADCVFRRNRASVRHPPIAPSSLWPSRDCAQGDGGATEMEENTGRVAISGCAFEANSAFDGVRLSPRAPVCSWLVASLRAAVQDGGAVSLHENTEAVIGNCSFVGNAAAFVSLRPASASDRRLSVPIRPAGRWRRVRGDRRPLPARGAGGLPRRRQHRRAHRVRC